MLRLRFPAVTLFAVPSFAGLLLPHLDLRRVLSIGHAAPWSHAAHGPLESGGTDEPHSIDIGIGVIERLPPDPHEAREAGTFDGPIWFDFWKF